MPKRVGFLCRKMLDKDLIRSIIITGSKGKRKRHDVKEVLSDVDGYTDKVYDLLIRDTYVPTKPRDITIKDASSGKERIISVVPYFPDGIIHQLAVEVMKDVLMRGMYRWSCASIPGRGNACAMKYVKRALHNDPKGTKYCAKLDIHHDYPTIDKDLLIQMLERKIKDRKFIKLIRMIIFSNDGPGLAIGFYINQWLANFYLEGLDRYICALPGVKYYVRNMDDLVLLGPNKKKLHRAVGAISVYLHKNLHQALKTNWQVFPVDARGIDFVGYRFYHGRATLRRRNFLRLTRGCRKARKKLDGKEPVSFHLAAGLLSRIGQLKHCNHRKVYEKYGEMMPVRFLKGIVRQHSRMLSKLNGGNNGKYDINGYGHREAVVCCI